MSALLPLLVFTAGAAAMLMGSAWIHSLMLVFGVTPLVRTLAISLFLLNFALGCALASRWKGGADRRHRLFAVPMVGLGLYGLLLPFLFPVLDTLYPALASLIDARIVRALLCWAVLLPPGIFLGAAVTGVASPGAANRGARLDWIHVSTAALFLGASAGAAAAGFCLLERFGSRGTLWTAALLGLAAGVLALWRPWGKPGAGPREKPDREIREEPSSTSLSLLEEARSSVVYAALFCTAFAGFTLVGLWERMFVFFLGNFITTRAVVIAASLGAAGLGALLLWCAGKRFTFDLAFGGLLITAGGLAVCLGLLLVPSLDAVLHGAASKVAPDPGRGAACLEGAWPGPGAALLACLLVLVPGALLLGSLLPLAFTIQVRRGGGTVREVGLALAAAGLGASLGAAASGWLIVPIFHIKMGIVVSAFMVVASGLLLFLFSRIREIAKFLSLALVGGALFLLLHLMSQAGVVQRNLIFESRVFKGIGPKT